MDETMKRASQAKVFLISLCLCSFVSGAEDIVQQLTQLTTLRESNYIEARTRVLASDEFPDGAGAFAKSENLVNHVCYQALLLRKREPEAAILLDRCLSPVLHQTGQKSSKVRPRIVVAGFGPERWPVVAESLLFSRTLYPYTAMETLVEMRVPESTDVLMHIAEDVVQPTEVRAFAVHFLRNVMQGLDAYHIDTPRKSFTYVPNDLKPKLKERDLPALTVEDAKRRKLWSKIETFFGDRDGKQLRAVAAQVLRSSPQSVEVLSRVLLQDLSPWVRAWCAISLQAIGSEEALKAVDAAKKTEKNAEVLLVLEGKAKPFEPWRGVPSDSILEKAEK
jgi:hypothetical protein